MPRALVGKTEPRLYTEPLRKLTRRTTLGYEVADFAEKVLGEPLLPWQRWLAIHALELDPAGGYRFKVVIVLVARQNGKSSSKRAISLWRMYLDGARNILGVAQDVALAREQWSLCQETIHERPDLEDEWGGVRNVNGDERFWLANRSRYLIRAMNRKAGRGYQFDEVNIDELREQRNWQAWSAVSKTIMARPNAQIWAMSNAGDDESVVLNQLRSAALAEADPSIGLFEWSAPDDCDLDDPHAWAQANPALGYLISAQTIRSALATDPPEVFRTEVLCQRVETLDPPVDMPAWRDCHDPAGTLDSARDRVAVCVEVAPDGAHVALVAAAVETTGRVRVETVAAWQTTDQADDELPDLLTRIKPAAVAWFPDSPTAAIARHLRSRKDSVEIKGAEVCEACMGFADLVAGRRILQNGDPLLSAHIAGSSKYPQGDKWRFARRDGVGHVNAAYAAAGAVQTALTLPPPKPRPLILVGRQRAAA